MALIDKPGGQQPTQRPAAARVVRPPALLVALQCALLVLVAMGFLVGGFASDLTAALLGTFGSVLLFGVVRVIDNHRRQEPGYADWSLGRVQTVSLTIAVITWTLGIAHVFRAARELTRLYNL